MTNTSKLHKRILAIYPNSRGFGFAILEGRQRLIDWGMVDVRAEKHKRCLKRIGELIKRYDPAVVVTEDPDKCPHRGKRVRKLIDAIRELAKTTRTRWRGFSREQVRRTFQRPVPVTKHQIAEGIAGRFLELASRLPPRRKPWMSEDARMAIFDAVALAITWFSV